jgi:hypothetical protein
LRDTAQATIGSSQSRNQPGAVANQHPGSKKPARSNNKQPQLGGAAKPKQQQKNFDRSGSDFQALVEKYKSKLSGPSGGGDPGLRKKWFDS